MVEVILCDFQSQITKGNMATTWLRLSLWMLTFGIQPLCYEEAQGTQIDHKVFKPQLRSQIIVIWVNKPSNVASLQSFRLLAEDPYTESTTYFKAFNMFPLNTLWLTMNSRTWERKHTPQAGYSKINDCAKTTVKMELQTEAMLTGLSQSCICKRKKKGTNEVISTPSLHHFGGGNIQKRFWWDEYQMEKKTHFGNNEHFICGTEILQGREWLQKLRCYKLLLG